MAAVAADLSFTDAQAKKIVNLAIEHGAYSDDLPDTPKGRKEAAVEAVEYCIDSWVNDGVRPDDKDEDIAEAGEAILVIFEAAGIEVDEDGNIIAGEPEADDEPEAEADADGDADGEAPFDPDDWFEGGYTELTPTSKLGALKELDLEDEATVNVVVQVYEWEQAQDKPSSRVLAWVEENIELNEEAEPEAEPDEEPEGEPEANEEPWDGYDKSNAVDIKKFLDEAMASEDGLTVDQVEYVKAYEANREKPPPRKRILDKCDELIAQIEGGGDEPEPAKPAKKALAGRGKKPAAKVAEDNGLVIELTREQILTALDSGTVSIEVA